MTTHEELNADFDRLSVAVLKVKAEREALETHVRMLEGVLGDIRDLIDGYVDVTDGDYGVPVANKAMRAVQLIDEALGSKP